jgi:uncharacterized membrane protein YcfT
MDILFKKEALTHGRFFALTSFEFIRFGQVVSLLGILILIVKFFQIKARLFLKIGQNTLPIYIVHVIILYGGIFGFGLNPLVINQNQNPWISIGISAAAILLFTLMIKKIEYLQEKYSAFTRLISFKNKK